MAAFIRSKVKNYLSRTLPRYGYELVPLRSSIPITIGNVFQDELITCNFCGTVFRKFQPGHPEALACPTCDAIARERVVYQCILNEINQRCAKVHLFFKGIPSASKLSLLECSPRYNDIRKQIYVETLGKYTASDYDMLAHRTDLKMDLTDEQDVAPFENSFDIIICAHVLEHIPDYRKALRNLNRLLTLGGFLVLQVPLLESRYTQVTWDEFHQDNTRVYHRFGFDLVFELDKVFHTVTPVVGLLDFEITSPEIKPDKYQALEGIRDRCMILGEDLLRFGGLGSPDLCDAIVAKKLFS